MDSGRWSDTSGRKDASVLDFAQPVPMDGYAWWYIDALSPDGRFGLTLIAFVGSVFSPYYAAARAAGPTDPLAHCCLNVCLYLPGAQRWTMIERGGDEVLRTPDRFVIGPSALDWDGVRLRVRFDERTPKGALVRGEVLATPRGRLDCSFDLDPAGRHVWRPLAVDAEVEVRLDAPSEPSWSGAGYIDHNHGSAPLERDFRRWTWSRSAADATGVARVDYDVELADGGLRAMSLRLGPQGVEQLDGRPPGALRPTTWGLPRRVRAGRRRVLRTFEDTPFYARSSIRAEQDGKVCTLMHEHLSLTRFAHPLMQWALPYKVKRDAS
jgi:carotenoid 1,2-hydratase